MGFFHELGSFISDVSNVKDEITQITDDIKTTVADTSESLNGLGKEVSSTLQDTAQAVREDIDGAVQEANEGLGPL
jgi:gas vesicle protein